VSLNPVQTKHYEIGICYFSAIYAHSIKEKVQRLVGSESLSDFVCQWLAAYKWFTPGAPVSSPRYNWNIVESGAKHQKQKQTNPSSNIEYP
jgi:hypothetical protein